MIPFDLRAVKSGAEVVTREGMPARFLGEINSAKSPLIFAVKKHPDSDEEIAQNYSRNGSWVEHSRSPNDLFMKPRKKKVWIAVCHEGLQGIKIGAAVPQKTREALKPFGEEEYYYMQVEIDGLSFTKENY